MLFPNPFTNTRPEPVPPPAHTLVHSNVQWNKPIFKAPPLKVKPPVYRNIESFLAELNRVKPEPEQR